MFLSAGKPTIVKIGPIPGKDGGAFRRPRLFHTEVCFSLNGSKLKPFGNEVEMPIDLEGYYNVTVPALSPGLLKLVITIDGLRLHDYNYIILSELGYTRLFTDTPESVIATNVPVKDGHVVTNPDMVFGIDFAKSKNLDAEMAMPNAHIGSVGRVASPHITDIQPVVDAVNTKGAAMATAHVAILEAIENIGATMEALDTILEQAKVSIGHHEGVEAGLKLIERLVEELDRTDYTGQLAHMSNCITDLDGTINESRITVNDVVEGLGDSLDQLAKAGQISDVSKILAAIRAAIASLNIPTVDEITGGGPLDTKDGRVRVTEGTDKGELLIVDGMVYASDIKDKRGYSLKKDGLEAMHTEITSIINEVKREIITVLKDEIKKKRASHHH